MIANKRLQPTVNFLKSLLTGVVLALATAPIIIFLTSANVPWVLMATFIWAIGSAILFHPFIIYIYPHIMNKASVYILTSVLIIISAWLNISIITLLLPYDYLYYTIFNTTLNHITLWGSLYIIILNAVITNYILISNIDFYKEESLF